jgi:hypothetical protein
MEILANEKESNALELILVRELDTDYKKMLLIEPPKDAPIA